MSYGSSDGFLSSDPAVISITVTPTNDPPISMDVTKALAQKSQGDQIQLIADDVDGDSLTVTVSECRGELKPSCHHRDSICSTLGTAGFENERREEVSPHPVSHAAGIWKTGKQRQDIFK